MHQHWHKLRTSNEAASHSIAPDIDTSSSRTADGSEYTHPRLSYRMQPDPLSPDMNEHEDLDTIDSSDWLMEAAVDLSQDLETSKKELYIIKFILGEMELRPSTDRRPTRIRGVQVQLTRACREHSSSRCHMLRERLRQVQSWAQARMMGQQVPSKAPDEVS